MQALGDSVEQIQNSVDECARQCRELIDEHNTATQARLELVVRALTDLLRELPHVSKALEVKIRARQRKQFRLNEYRVQSNLQQHFSLLGAFFTFNSCGVLLQFCARSSMHALALPFLTNPYTIGVALSITLASSLGYRASKNTSLEANKATAVEGLQNFEKAVNGQVLLLADGYAEAAQELFAAPAQLFDQLLEILRHT